jgi:hypothetical protein
MIALPAIDEMLSVSPKGPSRFAKCNFTDGGFAASLAASFYTVIDAALHRAIDRESRFSTRSAPGFTGKLAF